MVFTLNRVWLSLQNCLQSLTVANRPRLVMTLTHWASNRKNVLAVEFFPWADEISDRVVGHDIHKYACSMPNSTTTYEGRVELPKLFVRKCFLPFSDGLHTPKIKIGWNLLVRTVLVWKLFRELRPKTVVTSASYLYSQIKKYFCPIFFTPGSTQVVILCLLVSSLYSTK